MRAARTVVVLAATGLAAGSIPPQAPAPHAAGFRLRYKDEISPYATNAAFVLPSVDLPIAVDAPGTRVYTLHGPAGLVAPRGTARWTWRAPGRPGLYRLVVRETGGRDSSVLNVFVLVPAARVVDGAISGYRIGRYPNRVRGRRARPAPVGYVEVTPGLLDVPVGPHFRLRQFLCKQAGGYPKYLVLSERLVLKLEYLLGRLSDEEGIAVGSFSVMSGHRTPAYNAGLGNTPTSRHVWGEASDIFVDGDGDARMDDLNHDGRISIDDAQYLAALVERQAGRPAFRPFIGGLGIYGTNARHGPFIHVDVRGFRARW